MDKSELLTQIDKYKARRLKARLANYGTFVSIFLTLSIFAGGYQLSSLFSFLLILPLLLYFTLQSLRLARKSRTAKAHLSTLESNISLLESKFSFREFLTQPNFAFRLSLFLFLITIFTTFARLRAPEPSPAVTYHLEPASPAGGSSF